MNTHPISIPSGRSPLPGDNAASTPQGNSTVRPIRQPLQKLFQQAAQGYQPACTARDVKSHPPEAYSKATTDSLNQNIALSDPNAQTLIEKIPRHNLELGVLLGLDTEYLLSLCPQPEQLQEQKLRAVLKQAHPITMEHLLDAVSKVTGKHSGVVYSLEAIANKYQLTDSTTLDEEMLSVMMPHLLGIKSKAELLGTWLWIEHCQIKSIMLDVDEGGSCQVLLARVMKAVPSLSVADFINCFREENLVNMPLVRKLQEWAKTHEIPLSTSLSDKLKQQLQNDLLFKEAANWQRIGIALELDNQQMLEWRNQECGVRTPSSLIKKVLARACDNNQLTRGNILLALECLDHGGLKRALMAGWRTAPDSLPQMPEPKQIWQALQQQQRNNSPLQPALVYVLLRNDKSNNINWIRAALNLAPLHASDSSGRELALTILQASAQGTLTLDNLALICTENCLLSRELCPPPGAETCGSRLLQWRDIAQLAGPGNRCYDDKQSCAACIALLLGIIPDNKATHPLDIWTKILTNMPLLQTGHLQQLFNLHPSLQHACRYLPASTNAGEPGGGLTGLPPTVRELILLAERLASRPQLLEQLQLPVAVEAPRYDLPPVFLLLYQALNDNQNLKELLLQANGNFPVADAATTIGANVQTGLKQILLPEQLPSDCYECAITFELMTEDPIVIPVSRHPRPGQEIVPCYFSKRNLLQALTNGQTREDPETKETLGLHPISREWLPIREIKEMPVNKRLRDEIRQWQRDHPEYV